MGSERRTAVVLGGIALLLAAVTATTSGGLRWDFAAPHVTQHSRASSPGPQSGLSGRPGTPGGGQAGQPTVKPHSTWIAQTARLVLLVVAAAVVLAVVASLRLEFRRRQRYALGRRPQPIDPVPEDEVDPGDDLEALLDHQLTNLGAGTPRNAIVATWIRLEDFAAGHGVPRNPAETPAEFVSRALEAYGGGGPALERLAELYREARFSIHPQDEAQRDEARRCLEELTRRATT